MQQKSKPPEDHKEKLSWQREGDKGKGSRVGKNNSDVFRKRKEKHPKRCIRIDIYTPLCPPQGAQVVKNPLPVQETLETWVRSLGQEDPLEEVWQPIPVFLSGESHEQKSLAGFSL